MYPCIVALACLSGSFVLSVVEISSFYWPVVYRYDTHTCNSCRAAGLVGGDDG